MSSNNGSRNGKVVPAAFPPPVDSQKEFVKHGLDPEDELIEVGVVIVGGGTAGLACANRLLQLLADDPETMERLGEVPVAVIEKAKTCGGHNLSGAVMRPGPLEELFGDMTREQWREEGFAFGEVKKEAIYVLPNGKTKLRIPPPPPQRNHGNEVISVSALARFQQRIAEEAGAYILTETSATQLVVDTPSGAYPEGHEQGSRVVGVRSGDKGRGKDGEPLGNFEPGTDIKAQATVLAEGCWGHITGAAIREFDLAEGREPQVWELGVKEVWKVPKPLDRVIHTLAGWPLKISAKYHQIGGSWMYPMKDEKTGEDLVSIGFVLDLDYADATTSAHDLLQEFKTHPLVKGILQGGERVAWGAKALPAGGYWAMPKLSMPGAVLVGDAGGLMNLASLKGVHYAIKSGMLAAESIYAALKRGESSFESYETAVEESIIGKDMWEQRNTRQPFQKGLIKGGPLVNLMIATKGRFPGGRWTLHRNDVQPMFIGKTKDSYPKPDGKYTFDKLSSVFITGNATRDDAPNHIRVQKHVPREIAETWRWMCPAGVYEIPDDAPETGDVDVIVNYTNCVQCGAITAKGGRLTTPEGGDGPLYQIT
jgi:electron-transferring-flavoprotein dehydrogenase